MKKPTPEIPKKLKKFEFRFNFNLRNLLLILLILFFVGPFLISLSGLRSQPEEIPLSRALADIKEEKLEKINVAGDKIELTYKDGESRVSFKESNVSFAEVLKNADIDPVAVPLAVADQSLSRAWIDILGIVLPLGLMALFFLFILRQARGAQDTLFSFGQSRAKLFAKGRQPVSFQDVAGVDEAKKELEEIVDFLKNPGKYRRIGARTPKGVILFGPAGVGKTLLARAVAGEAGVPFFSQSGSEFMEMLVGVGASVTGDTPVLIKRDGKVRLLPIGEFVDRFYKKDKQEGLVKVRGVETLGLNPQISGFGGSRSTSRPVFGGSKWQPVEAVYRHQVSEIYQIKFLGGTLRTTGDHSVFVQEQGGIRAKEVRELKAGDVLAALPMNTRAWDTKQKKTIHQIKKHTFATNAPAIYLDVWQDDKEEIAKYQYALANQGVMSQYAVAEEIGVSQATVGHWQRGIHHPRALSKKLVKLDLPERVLVTSSLMKLFGYYTAERRGTNNLEFTFGMTEREYIQEVLGLMFNVFGLSDPKIEFTDSNTIKLTYYSAHLGRFFATHCGNGSHNKHLPSFIWHLPREYFLAFLEGYFKGDGYTTKQGKLSMTSVSHRLIRELAWLLSMHGVKVGIKHEIQKEGRVIRDSPLPQTESWTLIIGKTSNPFSREVRHPYQFKRAIVKKVEKVLFKGYVYDLCGVDNEAFFGGETPVLLHNSRVRDLFAQAKRASPSIIFIDEVDAIGRQRGFGIAGGHDEREQTLNQILVEMDGFTPNDNLVVIAATNRPDLLDPALLRPGRFDRRVALDMPDKEGRVGILKIHARGKTFAKGINWERVAERTVGFSGADIENMLNEAAILVAREDKHEITTEHIEEAATKVKLGPAKKRLQTEEDKKITAYHEAGHAIVTHNLPNMDPVHRISIVARGMSLGHTLIPPAVDRSHQTKTRLLEQITAVLGGRVAEELVFSEMTTGAANDIEQATRIARKMVVDFGMSRLGPIDWGPQHETDEMGRSRFWEPTQVSPKMQDRIDTEVKRIVDACYKEARKILEQTKGRLDKVAEGLLKKETLDREDFEKIVGTKPKTAPAFVTV